MSSRTHRAPLAFSLIVLTVLPVRMTAQEDLDYVPYHPRMPLHTYQAFARAIETVTPKPEMILGTPREIKPEKLLEFRTRSRGSLEILRRIPCPDLSAAKRLKLIRNFTSARDGEGAWLITNRGPIQVIMEDWRTVEQVRVEKYRLFDTIHYADELAQLTEHYRADPRPRTRGGWDFHDTTFRYDALHHAYYACEKGLTNEAVALLHAVLERGLPDIYGKHIVDRAADVYSRGCEMLRNGEARSRVAAYWQADINLLGMAPREWVPEYVEQLQAQAGEFESIRNTTLEDPALLPPAERAAYYIARFPDDVLHRHRQGRFVLQEKVVALGMDALPALVANLSNRRLMRVEAREVNKGSSSVNRFLRVQDIALDCIEELSGREFYKPMGGYWFFSIEGQELRESVRDQVLKWAMDRGPALSPEERLEALRGNPSVKDRLEELRDLEFENPAAFPFVTTAKGWIDETPSDQIPELAEALFERGDFSLLPVMRKRWRSTLIQNVRTLFLHGEAEDYGVVLDQAIEEASGTSTLSPNSEPQCLHRLWRFYNYDTPHTNLTTVPLLVFGLDYRRLNLNTAPPSGKKISLADFCMETLIRLTGHDEGFNASDPVQTRHQAIDRWQEWWQNRGRSDFIRDRPDIKPAFGRQLQDRGWTEIASVRDSPPSAYRLSREDLDRLVEQKDIRTIRLNQANRHVFSSLEAETRWMEALRTPPVPSSPATYGLTYMLDAEGPWLDSEGRIWVHYEKTLLRLDGHRLDPFLLTRNSLRFGYGADADAFAGEKGAMLFRTRALVDEDGLLESFGIEHLLREHFARLASLLPDPKNAGAAYVAKDAHGNVWYAPSSMMVGPSDRLISRQSAELGLPLLRAGLLIFPIGDGREVWVGTGTNSVILRRDQDGIVKVRDGVSMDAPHGVIKPILRDQQSRIWFQCITESRALHAGDGTLAARDPRILIFEDSKGGLWFMERDRRTLYRVAAREARINLSSTPQALCETPDGTVWGVTQTELVALEYHDDSIQIVKSFTEPGGFGKRLVSDPFGAVWVNSGKQVLRYGPFGP